MPRTELGAARLIQHRRQASWAYSCMILCPLPLAAVGAELVVVLKRGERLDQVRCGCGVGQGRPPPCFSCYCSACSASKGAGVLSGKYIRAVLGVQQSRDAMR